MALGQAGIGAFVTHLKQSRAITCRMDTAPAPFDWIGWLATIPGIPANWGQTAATTALEQPPEDDAPLPLAA